MGHIGLVLSGGFGKGAYQAGALAALNEYFKPEDFYCSSSASIGAINTYAYLTGNLKKALNIWETLNLHGGDRFVVSVMRSHFLQDVISEMVCDSRISSPFYVPLLDIRKKKLGYYNLSRLSNSEIKKYLLASISVPFVNKGIDIEGKKLYDGGVADNIPVYPVLKKEPDIIICIYFDRNYIFENTESESRILKITFSDNSIVSRSADIRHDSLMYMIEEGYKKTEKIILSVFGGPDRNIKDIREFIYKMNSKNSDIETRITANVVITNINKLQKKANRRRYIFD